MESCRRFLVKLALVLECRARRSDSLRQRQYASQAGRAGFDCAAHLLFDFQQNRHRRPLVRPLPDFGFTGRRPAADNARTGHETIAQPDHRSNSCVDLGGRAAMAIVAYHARADRNRHVQEFK